MMQTQGEGEVTEVAHSEIWVLMQSLPFCLTPYPYRPLLQELSWPKYYTVTLKFDFDFDFDDVEL